MTEDEARSLIEARIRDLQRRLSEAERGRDVAHANELAAVDADDDVALHAARDRRAFLDDKMELLNELMASEVLKGAGCDPSDLVPLKMLETRVGYERMRQWAAKGGIIPARKIRGRWKIPRGFKLSA